MENGQQLAGQSIREALKTDANLPSRIFRDPISRTPENEPPFASRGCRMPKFAASHIMHFQLFREYHAKEVHLFPSCIIHDFPGKGMFLRANTKKTR